MVLVTYALRKQILALPLDLPVSSDFSITFCPTLYVLWWVKTKLICSLFHFFLTIRRRMTISKLPVGAETGNSYLLLYFTQIIIPASFEMVRSVPLFQVMSNDRTEDKIKKASSTKSYRQLKYKWIWVTFLFFFLITCCLPWLPIDNHGIYCSLMRSVNNFCP